MSLHPITRSPSSSSLSPLKLPSLHLLLPRLFSSEAADRYFRLLHLHSCPTCPKPNLERMLSQTLTLTSPSPMLHSSTVDSVLRRSTSANRSVLLRFFVWAGMQRPYRHSAAAYSKACERLDVRRNPGLLCQLLDEYGKDGTVMSVRTFKIVLELCRQANLAKEAILVLKRMGEFNCRPDTSSYNAVLRLLVGGGGEGVDAAGRVLEEMMLCGVRPDMVTYVVMVKGLCGAHRLEYARVLVRQMRVHGCVPNVVVYSALVDGACKCGNPDVAMELLGEMEGVVGRDKPNVVSYTCLMQCLCEKRRVKDAVEVLDRMVRHGCCPNRVSVMTILRAFVEDGRVDEAYNLAERLVTKMNVSSEDCYSSFVMCLLENRNMQEAEKLVEKMLAMGVQPDGAVCSSLVRGLCSMGRYLDGFNWVSEMWKKGFSFDSDVYSVLTMGLCKTGPLLEAVLLIKGMLERQVPMGSSCVDSLVDVLKRNGENDLATQIMRSRQP